MTNRLNEFLGPIHNYKDKSSTTSSTTSTTTSSTMSSHPIIKHNYGNFIKVKHCATLHSWQNDVVRCLRNNNDVYVLVGAGGGKTLPMICYWVNDLLGLNSTVQKREKLETVKNRVLQFLSHPENCPKLIFLVPIQRLVEGQYKEMYEIVCDIIIGYVQLLFTKENSHNAIFDILRVACEKLQQDGKSPNSKSYNSKINNLINNYKRLYHAYTIDVSNKKIYEYKLQQTMDEILENSVIILKLFIERFIIGGAHGNKTFGNGGKNSIKYKPLITSVYESFESIMSRSDVAKLKNSIFVFDEAHTSQDRVETDTRAEQITNIMYHHILDKLNKSNRIAFLSGTANTISVKTMCRVLGEWYNRKIIPIGPFSNVGNQATLNIVQNNSIVDDSRIVELIKKPSDTNNLILVFSKNRINNICNKVIASTSGGTLQNIDNDSQNKKYVKTSDHIDFNYSKEKQYGKKEYSEKLRNDLGKELSVEKTSARQINNELLRECVKRGFGFIYRVDNMAVKEQDDMSVLIELFKQGKIHTIIATDSVGIGINVSVKNLYISATEKFNGKELQSMMISDLNQLINRAGRSSFKVATIYVPEMFLDSVTTAISATMDQYESGKTIIDFDLKTLDRKKSYRKYKALIKNNFVKSLEELDAAAMKSYNKMDPYIKNTPLDINYWKK